MRLLIVLFFLLLGYLSPYLDSFNCFVLDYYCVNYSVGLLVLEGYLLGCIIFYPSSKTFLCVSLLLCDNIFYSFACLTLIYSVENLNLAVITLPVLYGALSYDYSRNCRFTQRCANITNNGTVLVVPPNLPPESPWELPSLNPLVPTLPTFLPTESSTVKFTSSTTSKTTPAPSIITSKTTSTIVPTLRTTSRTTTLSPVTTTPIPRTGWACICSDDGCASFAHDCQKFPTLSCVNNFIGYLPSIPRCNLGNLNCLIRSINSNVDSCNRRLLRASKTNVWRFPFG